jgi:hypothetical protein
MKSFTVLFMVHLQLEFTHGIGPVCSSEEASVMGVERGLKAPAQLKNNDFVYESESRKKITKIPF